jgi:hypothetical protein
MITYLVILALLVVLEVCYFKVADRFNIIDKPNERSSHTRIVLRGGESSLLSHCGYGVPGMALTTLGCWLV